MDAALLLHAVRMVLLLEVGCVVTAYCTITGGMQYCYYTGMQHCYCNVPSLEACSIVTAMYYCWRHPVLLLHIVLSLEACMQYCYCNVLSLEACSIVTAYCTITGGMQYCYFILYYHWGMQYCFCGLIACVHEEYGTALGRRHGTISVTVSANVLSLEVCIQSYCIITGGMQYH